MDADKRSAAKNTVAVTVDRAIGTCHPEYPDMRYPINYGFIKGIMAPDGEEQDAYIIGIKAKLLTDTELPIKANCTFSSILLIWF